MGEIDIKGENYISMFQTDERHQSTDAQYFLGKREKNYLSCLSSLLLHSQFSIWGYFPLDFITHCSIFSLFKSANN